MLAGLRPAQIGFFMGEFMLKNILQVGLVIADEMEYAAWEELIGSAAVKQNFYARKGHRYVLNLGEKQIVTHSILCGIGTVNATAAAMYLVQQGVDIILNYGLSGGISGVRRGEDVIGTSFIEHDFDLVCCGYKPCEKPSQTYIYEADATLCHLLRSTGAAEKSGRMASGDRFVSDPVLRDVLKNDFLVTCCDMETAAIAYVCHLTDTPFACLRRVSDDAGEDATDAYHDMNQKPMISLAEGILTVIRALPEESKFWN